MENTDDTKTAAGHGFGTAPVFLAAISTILGAILFLRFGFAVGHVGLLGAVAIVLIGHAITIPTGLAVAEIATNLKVEGGGEYYIVSRSFGTTVGGAIGISLYFSQAVSVAFYLIAFAEAFRPLFPIIEASAGFTPDVRLISVPAAILLIILMIKKGANIGVSALWTVVGILAVALGVFFLGSPTANAPMEVPLLARIEDPHEFFLVFAIIFPAFTGMTAGVGLSGDLKNPRRSIPLGTMAATVVGLVVYLAIIVKLATSASPEELAGDQFVMSKIALWGPIIPIGLAAATISSAIGSILVAPRTLQALAGDKLLPVGSWNALLAEGRGKQNEPVNATVITSVIVLAFVSLGSVDFVAQIISMFFMITYGTLCLISFLEHFAGNPSYRPTFRTRWYFSLLGAVASFVMMFQMNAGYAALAAIAMVLIYVGLKRTRAGERDLSAVLKGVLFQLTRQLQVTIQKGEAEVDMNSWRPSFIAISRHSLKRVSTFDLLRWISHWHGFGTYIHYTEGKLTIESSKQAAQIQKRLISQSQASRASVYVDTIISSDFKTAVEQIVQIPGVSGMDNNSILFEFDREHPEDMGDIIESSRSAAIVGYNVCVLRTSDRHFGYRRSIHVWLTEGDLRNAALMIILAYIIAGHDDWYGCEIKLFAAYKEENIERQVKKLSHFVTEGRIPISIKNVHRLQISEMDSLNSVVAKHSEGADLIVAGLSLKKMIRDKGKFLSSFSGDQDILFVRAGEDILIAPDEDKTERLSEMEREKSEGGPESGDESSRESNDEWSPAKP
ncbi:MAG: amino acid permease [Calditrichaeota bacterium]|nr:amino acid permease [Calditrichota bacterium]MCB9391320.1 amino acid permease [Calditrichota bacterium]